MKWAFLGMVILVAIDQWSKIWVRTHVTEYELTPLIPNFIDLTYVENKGVSFSFLSDVSDVIRIPLLSGISLIAVVAMLTYLILTWKRSDVWTKQALIWIIPGAIGNLIDRVFHGAVTDFFHFRFYDNSFFVNNIADMFISVGVVFLIVSTFLGEDDSESASETKKDFQQGSAAGDTNKQPKTSTKTMDGEIVLSRSPAEEKEGSASRPSSTIQTEPVETARAESSRS